MTARTPIASTVPEPLGKPGGPGLFHHKGLQLPPYIQHVAHEMLKKGKSESEAIQMALGIVKKWAAGGGGVHPDVQAAAAKAVAEWEKDKALKLANLNAPAMELAGPKGYTHGWVRVGMDVTHKDGSRGTVAKYDPNTQTVTADWKTGPRSANPTKATTKAYHLQQGVPETRSVSPAEIKSGKLDESKMGPAEKAFRANRASKAVTLEATHKGQTETRTSKTPYTHAAVYKIGPDGTEVIGSWHQSEAAAHKGVSGRTPIAVVPVRKRQANG